MAAMVSGEMSTQAVAVVKTCQGPESSDLGVDKKMEVFHLVRLEADISNNLRQGCVVYPSGTCGKR